MLGFTLDVFKEYMDEIMGRIRSEQLNVMLGGDLNSKSSTWGPNRTDNRGEYLIEWLNSLNLVVINKVSTPIFVPGSSSSFIDVIFAFEGVANNILNWQVSIKESMILLRMIRFSTKVEMKRQLKSKGRTIID